MEGILLFYFIFVIFANKNQISFFFKCKLLNYTNTKCMKDTGQKWVSTAAPLYSSFKYLEVSKGVDTYSLECKLYEKQW